MKTNALSLRQAAARLHIHHATLRRWILDGEGPRTFIKVGRRSTYRILLTDFNDFVDRRSQGGK